MIFIISNSKFTIYSIEGSDVVDEDEIYDHETGSVTVNKEMEVYVLFI